MSTLISIPTIQFCYSIISYPTSTFLSHYPIVPSNTRSSHLSFHFPSSILPFSDSISSSIPSTSPHYLLILSSIVCSTISYLTMPMNYSLSPGFNQ